MATQWTGVDHEIPSWEDASKKQYAPKKLPDVFEKCSEFCQRALGKLVIST